LRIEFRNKHLLKLYTDGKTKKYDIPRNIFVKYTMRVQQLEAAVTIHDLWKTASLNFKSLKGFKNRYSVRVDKQWRLEIEIAWEDKEKTKGVIYIVELSKHYGD